MSGSPPGCVCDLLQVVYVYHQTFVQPSEQAVAGRVQRGRGLSEQLLLAKLRRYKSDVTGLKLSYQHVLKTVNCDQPLNDVYHQVLSFVLRRRSMAPHIPRILLLGPPGSGKSLQARLLTQKYKLVNVCCGQLVSSAAADGSTLGEQIKPYLEAGNRVPDSLVLRVLGERLGRLDCTVRGWILHGFPRDLEQARRLQESNYRPNRVFFLDITDEVAIERISLGATDPVSGKRYHALYHPAPNPEIQSRLQTHPDHTEQSVQCRLREYWTHTATLQCIYSDAVHVNADQDPHLVFESVESRLMERVSGRLRDIRRRRRTEEEGGNGMG
ncbi:adenylate kinase 8 isoform X1 [Lampris incognitus]|uniref:adenylate kinase 8 isoform X1 n=1 Tax=Lampris incognitus TaxID=2546036 RepID=UPI0024B48B58|nr:adenylate kinase 8 isoform X1 [Lampris incognitus]